VRHLLGRPIEDLTNRAVAVTDLFGPHAADLRERLREAPSWDARFAMIEAFVVPRVLGHTTLPAGVRCAWERLLGSGGRVAIGDLVDDTGWSQKHLITRFRHEIGLPPKLFARVLGFSRAIQAIRGGTARGLGDLAVQCGYHERHLWSFGTYSHAVPGEPSLFVEVRYDAGAAAVVWLTRAFGFVPGLQVAGDDGRVVHAELQLGDSVLMVNEAVAAPGHDRQAQHVYVAEPDAHHAGAVRAGATVVQPLADTPYGARGYCALDPEGFLWGFSTYRPTLV